MKSDQFKKVFEGSAVEANFIKTLLEENGIPVIIKEDMMSQVFPLYVASGELKPVKIYIDRKDDEKARKLISAYSTGHQKS